MWIVRLALHRPYTVATLCMAILLMGLLSIFSMKVDIFPSVDIPVVVVVWQYNGLSADDMERRVVIISERGLSTSVSGITHIESTSMNGIGVERVYFEPDSDIGGAIAQISAASLSAARVMPPGIQPPVLLRFNATNVQVAQMTVSGDGPSEAELFDYGLNFLRLRLFTVPGLSTPAPYGGKQRQVQIDVDPARCASKGVSPQDVVNAVLSQNVILPAGSARIGTTDYDVLLNSSPDTAPDFNALPLRVINGATVFLGDVASVYDGYAVQQNIVRVNGKRATYLSILKKENSSTLAVVDAAREMLPTLKAAAPAGFELKMDFDQSVFVRGAVTGVLREAGISAFLVAVMTLAFIGSWRSTIIVCISIPLSILVGIVGLKLTSQTFNLMTLGGLSLAIGMLVDDATVEVENINRNRGEGKNLVKAILDGASQIATPALAATLTICIVFFPVVMLTGPSKYLFIPLAIAVVFSMLASYLLSRTLVPTLAHMLLSHEEAPEPEQGSEGAGGGGEGPDEDEGKQGDLDFHGAQAMEQLDLDLPDEEASKPKSWIKRLDDKREHAFERLQEGYAGLLSVMLERRKLVVGFAGALIVASFGLLFAIGLDFFPAVDAGMLKIHFRAPPGTRIEQTEHLVDAVEHKIRDLIPPAELSTVNDNIGIPTSYNLGFVPTDNVNGGDAEILVALAEKHRPSLEYAAKIRKVIKEDFPGSVAYFQSADIVSQVLNFGASTPLDVQVEGADWTKTYPIAAKIEKAVAEIPGAEDVRIAQMLNHPSLKVDVDRDRAAMLGLTERDVASSMLTSLSSSSLVSPNFWVNPQNNVNYQVAVQTPLALIRNTGDILSTPITPGNSAVGTSTENYTGLGPTTPTATATNLQYSPPSLGQLASLKPTVDRAVANHYTVQPIIDVQATVENRDLGAVASDIQKVIDHLGPLGKGISVHLRGQSETMYTSFKSLGLGLVVAIALVYLLMVVLFQSWVDPLIIMVAIPGAFSGILWMLTLTGTSLNVESLMGSIMATGIAVSNSILLVTFANDARSEKKASKREAGKEEEDAEHAHDRDVADASEAKADEGAGDERDERGERGEREKNPKSGTKGAKNEAEAEKERYKPHDGMDPLHAAFLAGRTRLRPVIMTALAMLLGMLPMAFGLGEGGEQNAPLGRAVIGGILAATMMTLFVVPCVYALARKSPPRKDELTRRIDEQAGEDDDDETHQAQRTRTRAHDGGGQKEAHA